jgi:hypothetical protein
MTFGYNATAAFENSVAGIEEHARDLLEALGEVRRAVNVSDFILKILIEREEKSSGVDYRIGERATYNLHRTLARGSCNKTSQ